MLSPTPILQSVHKFFHLLPLENRISSQFIVYQIKINNKNEFTRKSGKIGHFNENYWRE
jgi:hypothetical protein